MRQIAMRLCLLSLLFASADVAAKDGWRDVKLEKDGRYAVDSFVLRGADLIGYFEEIKESEGVTDVVLVSKSAVPAEAEARFAGIATRSGLKPHIKEGRTMRDAKVAAPAPAAEPAPEPATNEEPAATEEPAAGAK